MNAKKYPSLMSPIILGNVMLRNRIVAPPHSMQKMTLEDLPRRKDVAFFELKAEGGCSVVTVGDCIVDGETGKAHEARVCLDSDKVIAPIHEIAAAIRRHGAVASIELNHAGRFANSDSFCADANGKPIYGPIEEILPNGNVCHQMDDQMIEYIIKSYGMAARRAKSAGFNMINLHGAHGWMISQFMSPVTNQRDDKWGGSFEKRMRFVDEVIAAVRKEVGTNFPIEMRLNGKENIPGGYEIEEAIRIAKHLEDKVQLINISAGNHEYMEAMLTFVSDMFKPEGHLIELAAAVKKEVKVPISAVGGLLEPELMEEMIATGKADIIAIGRGTLADPFIAKKIMQGKEDEIKKCMRCYACVGSEVEPAHELSCAMNPRIGYELDTKYVLKTEEPKKILVAGAGPAGLEFSIQAAKRGHEVTLCEASDEVGGLVKCEKHVPFKKRAYDYIGTQKLLAERAGVKICLNTKVTADFVKQFKADVLVAAIGSDSMIPEIPGIHGDHVILSTEILEELGSLGKKVVILGGGLVGAETAIHLAMEGKDVTIVELQDAIAADANAMHGPAIQFQIRDRDIKTVTGMRGTMISEQGLSAVDNAGAEHFFEADTIILATGMKPKWNEVRELQNCVNEFYAIGDCVNVSNIKNATATGYQLAMDI